MSAFSSPLFRFALGLGVMALGACTPARGPAGAERSPLAQKWLERARSSYAAVDLDDATDAIKSALQAAPDDIEVRTWGGRVALARLEYAETLRLLKGVNTTDARGLRGRAQWYAGDVEQAAEELESMLQDPEVHDGWAKTIVGLARRGAGRKPFQITGGIIAVSEMPRMQGSSLLLVPVEIDGEQALAMVATGTAEVTLDSATRKEPSWVSLRFGGRVEVKDVPAVVQDLSGLSRQMNVPIKALLGVNLLRHINVTFDHIGGQFIVRTFSPPIPPNATRVPIAYLKGGGMLMRSALSAEKGAPSASLLLDSAMPFPLALDQEGWKKAGTTVDKLAPVAQDPKLKQGVVPFIRLGAFDIPQVPAVFGTPIAEVEKGVGVDIDGVVGSGLLAAFRVTLTDEGKAMWLEDITVQQQYPSGPPERGAPPPPAPPGKGAAPPPAAPPGKGAAPPSQGGAPPAAPPSPKGSSEDPAKSKPRATKPAPPAVAQ